MRIKSIIIIQVVLFVTLVCVGKVAAQDASELWSDPATPSFNRAPLRGEFISYDIRELADNHNIDKNEYYLPLVLSPLDGDSKGAMLSKVEIPYMWLDREVYLRVEGAASFSLIINNRAIGYGEDSRVPSEFNISQYIVDGQNSIIIDRHKGSGQMLESLTGDKAQLKAYIFSQPKRRIDDYRITFVPDSVENCGVFTLEVILANSYNNDEKFSFGYDVYSPQNRLEHFDMREVEVAGNSTDTLIISQKIWRTPNNEWSAENPGLYYGMLIIRVGNRMVEYIPYIVGYGKTTVADGKILRNGKPIEIKAANYTVIKNEKETESELRKLKKGGINTLQTPYSQPIWLYRLCSKVGLYVIESANINAAAQTGVDRGRRVGGALSNNPAWENTFLSRAEATRARLQNFDCIIGWSLGGDVGNGYNMYRAYQLLKEQDANRAVIFNDAQGEWNSDLEPIRAVEAGQILGR